MSNITDEKEFILFIKAVGKIDAESTAKKKFDNFKKCMYAVSFGYLNRAFWEAPFEELGVSEELFYVHVLMYKYLTGNGYLSIEKYHKKDNAGNDMPTERGVLAETKFSKFHWNIPHTIYPFVCAYVLASSTSYSTRTGITVANLTERLTTYYDNAYKKWNEQHEEAEKLSDKALKRYNGLASYALGLNYFTTLEDILNKYSRSDNERGLLRNSVLGLTLLLMDCPGNLKTVQRAMPVLLNNYRDNIVSKVGNDPINIDSLYAFYSPMPMESHIAIVNDSMEELNKGIDDTLNYIGSYLNDNHDKTAHYEISITENALEKFESECLQRIDKLRELCDEAIKKYDDKFRKEYDKAEASPTGLTAGEAYLQDYLISFSTATKKYYSKTIMDELNSFVTHVIYASMKDHNPYNAKKANKNFSDLTDAIQLDRNNFKETISKAFEYAAPAMFAEVPAYIDQIGYPQYYYNEKEIIYRIIDGLYTKRK